ncbi:RNA polymerase sigma-70 factor (sigma-E family) [Catenuloplanes nepalensis]|uniref:RNA polymerase sigma-70 factor (Sigma-E family) n=1 Tax=Catenuloplanes nepalensis TaxID=587533 RepID=A0ABT9MWP2_9ACTN|nr:SigE family RNA polymerase sigma factor [Catenuloplanes nepalensis]MDP9795865.1 RNA polymerase sigma-70 factor (sigma-E family) [Catenuloplanes nepalensis]
MTFDEYVLARGPALVRFARLLTGDEHRAEDLAQDVLATAYVRWRRVGAMDRPDLYVRRMLVNAHHSWRRRLMNREVSVDAVRDDASVRDIAAETDERDAMWRLITRLSPRQRTVIVLRYYEDYDDATIAELLQCSQGTVRTQAKRALDRLQILTGRGEAADVRRS